MKYILLFLTFLPAALCAIGLLMWIWPKKKSYVDGLSMRQVIGKLLFLICLGLSLIEIGAMKRDEWFIPSDDNFYCYKISSDLKADTLLTDTVAVPDSLQLPNDSLCTGDSLFTYDLSKPNPNVFEIPFTTNKYGNARYITLNVGTAKIKAMFDTGCEYAICLSHADYFKIVGAGLIEENKFSGKAAAMVADGRTVEVLMFNLPECSVGNGTFTDVMTGVSEGDVTLVGNPLFKDYQITIDDANKKLILKKNGVSDSNCQR